MTNSSSIRSLLPSTRRLRYNQAPGAYSRRHGSIQPGLWKDESARIGQVAQIPVITVGSRIPKPFGSIRALASCLHTGSWSTGTDRNVFDFRWNGMGCMIASGIGSRTLGMFSQTKSLTMRVILSTSSDSIELGLSLASQRSKTSPLSRLAIHTESVHFQIRTP